MQGAILAGVRSSATQALLLVDVAPLSLGIETEGKLMSTIIKRNTPIPVRKTKEYTTVVRVGRCLRVARRRLCRVFGDAGRATAERGRGTFGGVCGRPAAA